MEKQFVENNLKEMRFGERKKEKRRIAINILGGISLAASFISLFLILTLILREVDDRLMLIGVIFSTLVFSLIGMICGTIGFLKARILRKGGHYATSGAVLNAFGLVINAIEILGLTALTFSHLVII